MEEQNQKTIIHSFICIEVVEPHAAWEAGQTTSTGALQPVLTAVLRDVAIEDRIILDTDHGAVISFLAGAEDAFGTVLNFLDHLEIDSPLKIRMGVNTGPVRWLKDNDGQPAVAGDGIYVAQQLMAFARAGQVLASRAYLDTLCRLSSEYASKFHHVGLLTDRHVRTHEVFQVLDQQSTIEAQDVNTDLDTVDASVDHADPANRMQAWARAVPVRFQSIGRRYIALLAGSLVIAGALGSYYFTSSVTAEDSTQAENLSRSTAVAATRPSPIASVTGGQKAEISAGSRDPVIRNNGMDLAAGPVLASAPTSSVPAADLNATPPVRTGDDQTVVKSVQDIIAPAPAAPAATLPAPPAPPAPSPASVSIVVIPWGEVYLDGKLMGASPPLTDLRMAPGSHEIKFRNTAFPTYTQYIRVEPNDKLKIRHRFAN
ncbi:MAG: PEGA domain-containing protein [Pseudomonadota bacterium]